MYTNEADLGSAGQVRLEHHRFDVDTMDEQWCTLHSLFTLMGTLKLLRIQIERMPPHIRRSRLALSESDLPQALLFQLRYHERARPEKTASFKIDGCFDTPPSCSRSCYFALLAKPTWLGHLTSILMYSRKCVVAKETEILEE